MVLPIITPTGNTSNQSPSKRIDVGSPQGKVTVKTASPAKQAKKINSLGLFFRKVSDSFAKSKATWPVRIVV